MNPLSPSEQRAGGALDALDATREAIVSLGTEIQALRAELLATRAENGRLLAQNQAASARLGDLDSQNQLLNASVEEHKTKVQQLDAQTQQLCDTRDALEAQLAAQKQGNESMHAEILKLYRELRAADLPTLILRIGLSLTGAEAGLFVEPDGDGTLASVGLDELPAEIREALYDYSRRAAQDEAPFICNDSNELPDGSNLVNLAAMPVALKDETRGVILIANKRSGPFSEEDTDILLAIGRHASLAMENSRLHCELGEAYAGTVAVLADAIEAKDAYTRGHCQSVSEVAVEVASRLGFNAKAQDEIRYAALLHDIGKIGVPDGILLKPGKLLPEEFSIIQKHAAIGRDLVARVPGLAPIAEVILHHHEKWDGSGYPDGLAGEGIPIGARIIGAVDALDAMTTPRPYREAVSHAIAMEEMRRCSGSHFDPQIVELVTEVMALRNVL